MVSDISNCVLYVSVYTLFDLVLYICVYNVPLLELACMVIIPEVQSASIPGRLNNGYTIAAYIIAPVAWFRGATSHAHSLSTI